MEHSIIAASSAHIWGKPEGCTAWPLMSQQFPETEPSIESMEGTAAHEIGTTLIEKGDIPLGHFEGKTATNGIIFTEEMYDSAKIYADDVKSVLHSLQGKGHVVHQTECRVDIKRVHDLAFGTMDDFIYHQAGKCIYIWDFKHGYDIVEVFENWQLLMYLCGLLDKLSIDGNIDQRTTVHLRIVQPRGHHRDGIIREWIVNAADCRAYFNILRTNANIALSNNAVARSGSHCKHCTARHACTVALQSGIQLYEVAAQPVAIELSPLALGVQLGILNRAIKQLECIKEGMKEQAKGVIRKGQAVPGWEMQHGKGKEVWTKTNSEVIALGECMEIDLRNNKPITVKQARDKGMLPEMLNEYSERQKGGLQLVPDNGSKLRKVFLK